MPDADESTAPPGWAPIYEAHAATLNRLAILLVGHDDAHDLVADGVLRAVSSRRWASIERPGAYLAQTLVHLASDRRRASTRRIGREQRVAVSGRVTDPASDITRKLMVADALGSLTESQLAVVYLHYWEDMTLQQVADHLDVRLGTVSTQLDRAKKRLRSALTPTFDEGEVR